MTDTTTQAVTALLDTARAAQADAKAYREANGITQIDPGFVPLMIDTLAALLDNRNTAQANYAATWQANLRLVKERDALAAQLAAAESRARESALEALSAYGQAAEAYEAQLAAEAKLATARGDALEEAARMIEQTAYTSNGGGRSLEPVSAGLAGMDMHHATIAAAIRALAKGGE